MNIEEFNRRKICTSCLLESDVCEETSVDLWRIPTKVPSTTFQFCEWFQIFVFICKGVRNYTNNSNLGTRFRVLLNFSFSHNFASLCCFLQAFSSCMRTFINLTMTPDNYSSTASCNSKSFGTRTNKGVSCFTDIRLLSCTFKPTLNNDAKGMRIQRLGR